MRKLVVVGVSIGVAVVVFLLVFAVCLMVIAGDEDE